MADAHGKHHDYHIIDPSPWPALGSLGALTMAIQISLSILVLQVFTRGSFIWYWAAVGYHALIDAVAVFAPRFIGLIGVEVVLTLFAIFSIWLIFRFRPHPEAPAEAPPEVAPAPGG